MSVLRITYLLLTVVGTIVPMIFYLPWARENGFAMATLIAAWKVSPATTGLYWDMLIAATALSLWIATETYVRKDYWALVAIPVTFLIGISAGLPLFLFLRARPVR